VLPDELQHQELVKIGIEQRPRNRVECPVVVVSPLGKIDDHRTGSATAGVVPLNEAVNRGRKAGRGGTAPFNRRRQELSMLERMATLDAPPTFQFRAIFSLVMRGILSALRLDE
jgi:hypothetical protein